MREKLVLIVERDSSVAFRIGETLEAMGLHLSLATTALEARLRRTSGYFDLVIVDERVLDQPFEELIAYLHQAQSPPPCVLFMLSRATLRHVGNGAREINALFQNGLLPDQIITKPFLAEELRAMVNKLLSPSRA